MPASATASHSAPWIATHVERKGRLDCDAMLAVARRGVRDSLAAGITTTADYSFSGAAATAAPSSGCARSSTSRSSRRPAEAVRAQFEELSAPLVDESELVAARRSHRTRRTRARSTSTAGASSLGIPVGTHLAESANENEWLEHGTGPLAGAMPLVEPPGDDRRSRRSRARLLGPELLCAHCVELDAEEVALLAAHDVPVAHCPRSNALLGCGIAPLAELRAAGLRVGLGTDSPASTPSFDLFEELRAAIYAARARERRPDALSADRCPRLATLGSARALGLDDEIGSLDARQTRRSDRRLARRKPVRSR